ncbi:DUF2608 domain-containing protein [Thermomonas sp.]|uniref:DUF2608 domain-containing protein n=1 Tax=Thermomonas sp. TaxID=1971895 RepID=UPI002489C2FB|nr:DUF2608 domain-containing protein [Thermomonas sp.]MDI1252350.1 DUF2608 domain-containing protein [Thermomonas sp.]
MRRTGPILLVLALLTACAGTPVAHAPASHAPESQVTDIQDLAQIAAALAENGRRRTLLVMDIDDTLLTSQGFFGSDRWYEWQKHLQANDPAKVPCLFDVISLNYEAGTQQLTQPDGPALINAFPGDKLMLTSRNPLYRGGTVRTLHDAGYALPMPLAGQTGGSSWRWRKAPDARESEVSYDQGIFMTAGQDKGLMLLDLLGRLKLHYDRVLLVDDGDTNIRNMQSVLRDAGIDYHGLHYTRVDKTVSKSDAKAGLQGWQTWQVLLSATYPERLDALNAGHCAY